MQELHARTDPDCGDAQPLAISLGQLKAMREIVGSHRGDRRLASETHQHVHRIEATTAYAMVYQALRVQLTELETHGCQDGLDIATSEVVEQDATVVQLAKR
jgi:hypothetical protein